MFFINPMWDHESQRIGKMKCTPTGYRLHVLSDFLGFLGLICLISVAISLVVLKLRGDFSSDKLLFFSIPLILDILSTLLYHFSWKLADVKGFEYNGETSEASWVEKGERITYRWPTVNTHFSK